MCYFFGSIHSHKRSIKVIRKFTTLSLNAWRYCLNGAKKWHKLGNIKSKLFSLLQIRPMGDQADSCRNNCRHLDARRFCEFCANLLFTSPTRAAARVRRQIWQRVSDMCARSDSNLCCSFQLYQFLCSLYSYDRNLLQVCWSENQYL
jgi:hypothetical protein